MSTKEKRSDEIKRDTVRQSIRDLYEHLMKNYGPQGWWPLLSLKENNSNPTNRGLLTGYHPRDFNVPSTPQDIFEVMIGAILTQNTTWINAEKALFSLSHEGFLDPKKLREKNLEEIASLIRSSGYYNQKAIKIHNLIEFLTEHPIEELKKMEIRHLRKILINVKGIGPETADSIILYALKKPIFVVDAYTKRIFIRTGILKEYKEKELYDTIQHLVEDAFKNETEEDKEKIFNEFHALLVHHAVKYCLKKPRCNECFLSIQCPKHPYPKKKQKKKKTSKEPKGKKTKHDKNL